MINLLLLFLEQKIVISDSADNDKVLTKAELTVAVDLLILAASATGSLSLDDYNKDETDDDYFLLREKMTLKEIFFLNLKFIYKMESYISFRASFRFKANVKTDLMSDKLLRGVDEESCREGENI